MTCSTCKKGKLIALGSLGRTKYLICDNKRCRQHFMQDLGQV